MRQVGSNEFGLVSWARFVGIDELCLMSCVLLVRSGELGLVSLVG